MRRARAIAVSTAAAISVGGGAAGSARAGSDDDNVAQLAEAQFEIHLLTETDLVPTDVTCAAPPPRDAGGDLLCFALVGPRATVAALATPDAPGQYSFTTVSKVDVGGSDPAAGADPAPAPQPAPEAPEEPEVPEEPEAPEPQNAVDQAVLDTLQGAVDEAAGLSDVIREDSPEIASVDDIAYHAPTSTLQVAVTTSAATPR